jgi:hypothetical protein
MGTERVDISGSLAWEEGIPRPQWDLLSAWIEERVGPEGRFKAWTEVCRQWLRELGSSLGRGYRPAESDNFLLLAPLPRPRRDDLLHLAERCRQALLSALPGLTAIQSPGKHVVLTLKYPDNYYAYVAPYCPEGRQGSSSGVQLREGYPHIVLAGVNMIELENTLAHELTHASLSHLSLPVWMEEGLARMFEHNQTGRELMLLTETTGQEHKRFWTKHSLQPFWQGEGFTRAGLTQRLSYELAEILLRLLWVDHAPRWFGFDRRGQRRFFAFLRGADRADGGEATAQAELGFSLGELAAQFLGPGDWTPRN